MNLPEKSFPPFTSAARYAKSSAEFIIYGRFSVPSPDKVSDAVPSQPAASALAEANGIVSTAARISIVAKIKFFVYRFKVISSPCDYLYISTL